MTAVIKNHTGGSRRGRRTRKVPARPTYGAPNTRAGYPTGTIRHHPAVGWVYGVSATGTKRHRQQTSTTAAGDAIHAPSAYLSALNKISEMV